MGVANVGVYDVIEWIFFGSVWEFELFVYFICFDDDLTANGVFHVTEGLAHVLLGEAFLGAVAFYCSGFVCVRRRGRE